MGSAAKEKCNVCWESSARDVWPTREVMEDLTEGKSESKRISGNWLVNWKSFGRILLKTEESAFANILRQDGAWPEWWESREPRREEKNEDRDILHTTLRVTLRSSDFIQKAMSTVWKLSSTLCFIKWQLLYEDWFGGTVSPMVWRGRNMVHRTEGLWLGLETIVETKKWKSRFLSFSLTPSLLLSLSLSLPLSLSFSLPSCLPFFPFSFFKTSWLQHWEWLGGE